MSNEINGSLFEDSSTIHFGGDGEEAFDFLQGFDDAGAAEATDTTDASATEEGAEQTAQGEETAEGAPTTEQAQGQDQPTSNKLTFKAKVDHQEQDVSVDESELPSLYQKAMNMDRANQRANTARQEADGYKSYIEQIAETARTLDFQGETAEQVIEAMLSSVLGTAKDAKVEALVSGGTTKEVAEFIVDQQMKAAEHTQPTTQTRPIAEEGAAPSAEQFSKDLQQLISKRPELRSMQEFPEEVLAAYAQGENLTVAYLDYESRKTAAEMKALANQNKIFKQNQESANKAPVKGVTGSGGTDAKEDIWLKGFDDNYW